MAWLLHFTRMAFNDSSAIMNVMCDLCQTQSCLAVIYRLMWYVLKTSLTFYLVFFVHVNQKFLHPNPNSLITNNRF